MPDAKKVAIGTKETKMEFTVPQPYEAGHSINAVEAKVLNQTFAENVCNNMRSKVQATINGEEGALSRQELDAAFNKYATEYEFTEAAVGAGRSTMTPLEKESRKIATAIVNTLLQKEGRKRKDVDKEAYASEVARFAETDKVQKLATKNLKDMESIASAALEAVA